MAARAAQTAASLAINVRNNSTALQSFYFFQQPVGTFSNSLFARPLLPYANSGATLTFKVSLQNYAGVQQQLTALKIGASSGELTASQPIEVTSLLGDPPTLNTTTMIVSPSLGLSVPVSTAGPTVGTFRIVTPVFNPVLDTYNGGLAMQTTAGSIILSSFVTLPPNANFDCRPVAKFYVQTGTYPAGTLIDFSTASPTAALCDATPGYAAFAVVYNIDGSWTVTPYASLAKALARDRH